jgi:putative molybdopterin biosynthesis protein
MTEEKYYTIEEVAKMLKVAYLTVYRWIQDGKLKAYKAGKQYRVNEPDLDRFITIYKGKNAKN